MSIKQLKAEWARMLDKRAEIRESVETALQDVDELAHLTDTQRAEFIDDCVDLICNKISFYSEYTPDYNAQILDAARLYGYID